MDWLTIFYFILAVLVSVVHDFLISGGFFFAMLRIVFANKTPYSAFYIATVLSTQSLYIGCPISDINIFLYSKNGNVNVLENALWFGLFKDYQTFARLIFVIISLTFFYYSWKEWYRVETVVDFRRIWQTPKFRASPEELAKYQDFTLSKLLSKWWQQKTIIITSKLS